MRDHLSLIVWYVKLLAIILVSLNKIHLKINVLQWIMVSVEFANENVHGNSIKITIIDMNTMNKN